MNFLKSIFGKKEQPIKSNADFWNWFKEHEKEFFLSIKEHKNVQKDFLDKLTPKLNELKDGYYCVTGMYDNNTAELILTADGDIKNIVFTEELVAEAPKLNGWKFTALKPALNVKDVSIEMAGYKFSADNLFFYSNHLPGYPDQIDISVIHNDLNDDNKNPIISGVYIFLDNYLGEIGFLNNIDNLKVIKRSEAEKELISIEKLKNFLTWRQKEFIEKYEGVRHNTENDEYSVLEAELESGNILIATINKQVLNWDSKASHPWIGVFTIKYDGSNNNGMPNKRDYENMDKIEEELMQELKDKDGYINIGRQTSNSERNIYFACKDFRKPSKIFFNVSNNYKNQFEIEYDIYKDKYWQTFERFNQQNDD